MEGWRVEDVGQVDGSVCWDGGSKGNEDGESGNERCGSPHSCSGERFLSNMSAVKLDKNVVVRKKLPLMRMRGQTAKYTTEAALAT